MVRADLRLCTAARLRYLLALPSSERGEAGKPPVLCFLHGYDEAAPIEIHAALTVHGPMNPANALLIRDRFIVVAPQLPQRGDIWHRYADDVRTIVQDVCGAHGGDEQRTYLTGFSYGGNGVFDLALAQPAQWAALWAVDPTRPPVSNVETPVWLSAGEAARRRRSGFMEALALVDNGESATGDRVWLDQGEDHVGSAHRAYCDERIYDWLASYRLGKR